MAVGFSPSFCNLSVNPNRREKTGGQEKEEFSLHKFKEIMRLQFEKDLSFHKIAQSENVYFSTV